MALTNDQITAQNFKDFYGQIRPYLNGQVPTFANQFSRSDLYSTDEKIIGQWIDGKPLYQKTIDFGALPNNTTKSVNHNIQNIDYVVNLFGAAYRSSDGIVNTLPCYNRDIYGAELVSNPTSIIVTTFADRSAFSESYIAIQYTKTTDSAIKVGTGTDYSTEEQIIGTWIDGKPIYQKTIELTNVSLPEAQQITNVTLLSNATYNYIESNGIIVSNSSGNADTLPLTNFDRTKGSIYYSARVRQQKQTQDKDIVLTLVNYNGSADTYTVSVTIRYTKTTD